MEVLVRVTTRKPPCERSPKPPCKWYFSALCTATIKHVLVLCRETRNLWTEIFSCPGLDGEFCSLITMTHAFQSAQSMPVRGQHGMRSHVCRLQSTDHRHLCDRNQAFHSPQEGPRPAVLGSPWLGLFWPPLARALSFARLLFFHASPAGLHQHARTSSHCART